MRRHPVGTKIPCHDQEDGRQRHAQRARRRSGISRTAPAHGLLRRRSPLRLWRRLLPLLLRWLRLPLRRGSLRRGSLRRWLLLIHETSLMKDVATSPKGSLLGATAPNCDFQPTVPKIRSSS